MKTAEEMAGIILAMIFSDPPASHEAMVEELEKFKFDAFKAGMTRAAGVVTQSRWLNPEMIAEEIKTNRDNLKPEDMK